MDQNSYKNLHLYHIGYVPVKNFSCATINSVNHCCLIINKINGYMEESNENKYFTLVTTDEIKDTLNNY